MTKKNKRILNEACEVCGRELQCRNCLSKIISGEEHERNLREAELLALLKGAVEIAGRWIEGEPAEYYLEDRINIDKIKKKIEKL